VAESTRNAVLGLLAQQPLYGYALCERLARWPLDDVVASPRPRSIYRALERLRDEQLIERTDAPHDRDPDGPNRARYQATAAGERRLEAWLRSRPESFADLCMRIVAARRTDLPLLLAAAEAVERNCLADLQDAHEPDVSAVAAAGGS
jgi:DNA-binding PadR family transcriptional regulator